MFPCSLGRAAGEEGPSHCCGAADATFLMPMLGAQDRLALPGALVSFWARGPKKSCTSKKWKRSPHRPCPTSSSFWTARLQTCVAAPAKAVQDCQRLRAIEGRPYAPLSPDRSECGPSPGDSELLQFEELGASQDFSHLVGNQWARWPTGKRQDSVDDVKVNQEKPCGVQKTLNTLR